MEPNELQNKIEKLNSELREYASAKQSLYRMSTRLRKLCKRLTPTHECVLEMQNIAEEIRAHARTITS